MISTFQFDHENFPVPNEWVFENFLPINEKLIGQTIKIRSVFNAQDTDPSFMLYINEAGKYKFVDFSSGYKGDGVHLVQLLYNLDKQEAYRKIFNLYKEGNTDIHSHTLSTFTKPVWTITHHEVRGWNTLDQEHWSQFHIGSDILNYLNVKPLSKYIFEKKLGVNTEYFQFDKPLCYGFFTAAGELYKIYNPGEKKTKYIKVKDYIQGKDQLQYKAPWLLIQSGIKDIAAFKRLKISGMECIAADSENSILSEADMLFFKSKYPFISILFDNDAAGLKSAAVYKERFDLQSINFTIEKDVADCLKEHGVANSRLFMLKSLTTTFNTYYK
jgi:hypothetical protein